MSFLKNILLLIIVLVLSYFTAHWFGNYYIKFSAPYDRSMIGLSDEAIAFEMGIASSYTFFTILVFQLFGFGNRKKWTLWLLLPAALFFASGDIKHLYLPILLGLIAYAISRVFRFIL